MSALIPETTLSNGLKIFYLNKEEVDFLYEEMPLYFKHGIEVHEGDTIFDIGANIGLFTLFVCQLCNNNANIYAKDIRLLKSRFLISARGLYNYHHFNCKYPCSGRSNSSLVIQSTA